MSAEYAIYAMCGLAMGVALGTVIAAAWMDYQDYRSRKKFEEWTL